jgi:GNAT superfamily N-acetyltransferase
VTTTGPRLRAATIDDCAALLHLWTYLFDAGSPEAQAWRAPASEWFSRFVDDPLSARFPLIEWSGRIVATAIGTLELGVPNPHCVRGRTVRLSNVFTLPEHRGSGYGTRLVRDVIDWARSIDADRVDLSTTQPGRSIYEKVGFIPTTAPRMKLVL